MRKNPLFCLGLFGFYDRWACLLIDWFYPISVSTTASGPATTPKAPKRAQVITLSQSPTTAASPTFTCREFASPTRQRDVIIPLSPHKVKPVPSQVAAPSPKPQQAAPAKPTQPTVADARPVGGGVTAACKPESVALEEARERVFGDIKSPPRFHAAGE